MNARPVTRVARLSSRVVHGVYRRVLRSTVERLFLYGLVGRTANFQSTHWMGVPIMQNVLDVWTIQETICEIRPALLIEIGTYKGGSALFYAQLLELFDHGRVVTVDIQDIREHDHSRIDFIHGDSLHPDVVARVQAHVDDANGPVLVILDGNHYRDHVRQELELYAPMVTPGSFLLSQDGVIDVLRSFRHSRPGPLTANREFLERHPEFEHDRKRNERFGPTHHPSGWMRRLR